MNSRTWLVVTVAIICIIAVCSVFYMKTAGTGFFPSPSDGAGNGTPDSVNATTRPVTGRPCRTHEEWHRKADEVGAWIIGILVDQSFSDTEIMSILSSYDIPPSSDIRISEPNYIGYYIEIPEPQYQQVQEMIDANYPLITNPTSSSMFIFTAPSTRYRNDSVIFPVFVADNFRINESVSLNESIIYEDLVDRGFPVKKSKVIEIDLRFTLPPHERELLLKELSADERILFTYKIYVESVLC